MAKESATPAGRAQQDPRVIVALDYPSAAEALKFVDRLISTIQFPVRRTFFDRARIETLQECPWLAPWRTSVNSMTELNHFDNVA